MDDYVNLAYDATVHFSKEEMFVVTSQLRRASLSIILNYIEGYARRRLAVYKNFLETFYGSLQESKYLVYFSHRRQYLNDGEHQELSKLADRIGSML